MCIVMGLYFFGLLLNTVDVIPNYQYHRHAFLLLPYLLLGVHLKFYPEYLELHLNRIGLIGIITLLVEWILHIIGLILMPSHDANISISFLSFPIHIVNVILGTAAVLYISKKINKNSFLQTMGMGTLLAYLLNRPIH